MNLSHAETRRRLGGRFRLALAALALAVLVGASAPASAFPTTARFSAPAQPAALAAVPLAQAGSSCQVYPIAVPEQELMSSPTAPGPRPMPNPWADVSAIPQYSRFRVSFVGPAPYVRYLRWTEDTSSLTLAAALAGGGTLGSGFAEGAPPATDPGAERQVNGILEAGDWLSVLTNQIANVGIPEILDRHIAQRTLMILPVYDTLAVSGSLKARTSQLIRVRLLSYNLSSNPRFLEFGLVAHLSPYACFRYHTPALVGQTALITPSMPLSATLERRWDFGDGSPISTALTPSHAYAQPGTYTVTLTLPRLVPFQAVGRIEVARPLLPPQVFLPITLRRSAP
ncbi:MAG TPA: PKD domain-containing protein [Herpetosiphonaceae bacterium]